jgi:NADH-quinone oxidoreductase subunit H
MIGGFWMLLAVKLMALTVVIIGGSLVIIYAELKVGAHMQNRVGPYYAGVRWGWAQPLADAVKFLQKEDLVPAAADAKVFKAAPMVSLMGTMAVFVIVPFSPKLIARDLDLGIFYALAAASLGTLAMLMAGWSSANKFSLMGGLRAAAQLIAYELPMVLAVVGVVVQAGALSMVQIVDAQVALGLPYVVGGQAVGFFIFVTASLAELTRTPFDMPIAESELVSGYMTEYSGIRFTMFYLAEYAGLFAAAAIASTLFLGGYHFPGLDAEIWGPFILLAKVGVLAFLMIWFRWTWPRVREDQLQSFAWRWLVPLALANIAATAVLKVVL